MTRLGYEYMRIAGFWRDAWTPENSGSSIPMLRYDSTWDRYDSSFWVHRIDFLKLKNLQLGYAFPERITSKLKMQRLYVYANAQNLFTVMWKKAMRDTIRKEIRLMREVLRIRHREYSHLV